MRMTIKKIELRLLLTITFKENCSSYEVTEEKKTFKTCGRKDIISKVNPWHLLYVICIKEKIHISVIKDSPCSTRLNGFFSSMSHVTNNISKYFFFPFLCYQKKKI